MNSFSPKYTAHSYTLRHQHTHTHSKRLPVAAVAPPLSKRNQAWACLKVTKKCLLSMRMSPKSGPVPLWNCVLTSLRPLLLLLPPHPHHLPRTPPQNTHYIIKISLDAFLTLPPLPTRLALDPRHTHACTHLVLYKGETTAWLQLHKHNFWQHYCTLKPTV